MRLESFQSMLNKVADGQIVAACRAQECASLENTADCFAQSVSVDGFPDALTVTVTGKENVKKLTEFVANLTYFTALDDDLEHFESAEVAAKKAALHLQDLDGEIKLKIQSGFDISYRNDVSLDFLEETILKYLLVSDTMLSVLFNGDVILKIGNKCKGAKRIALEYCI
jgi:hypothetical protein